jgi:chorismate mutase
MQMRYGILILFAMSIFEIKVGSPATDPLRSLVQTSAQRLQIAEKVALAKWHSGAPVEDASRELEVIQKAVRDGTSLGLEPADVEKFFKAQIEANKLIQYSLLAEWHREGRAPVEPAVDLAKGIRPQLDEIENRLIQELKLSAAARTSKSCPFEVAKAVGEHLDSHSLKVDSRDGVALDRAMSSVCIR